MEWIREWAPLLVVIVNISILALVEKMRRTFLTKEEGTKDLNGATQRIDLRLSGHDKQIEMMQLSLDEMDTRLNQKRDRITKLEERDAFQAQRMNELVVQPLQKVVDRIEKMAETQTRQSDALMSLTQAVERLEQRIDRHEQSR